MGNQPLCFVMMPFGEKPDPAGGADIDFDRIYKNALEPGIKDAGMIPIRADEEELGGIIPHQGLYERLLVCDFAVADLTVSNANVLYELGIRHAARPRTTLTVYAAQKPLPIDVALLRTEPYELGEGNSFPDTLAGRLRQRVCDRLHELKRLAQAGSPADSPLFQLVRGWAPAPLPLAASASFKAQILAYEEVKKQLSDIRARSRDDELKPQNDAELDAIRTQVLASGSQDPGVLTFLMLGYQALSDWAGMIEVYGQLPEFLQEQVMVRQMLAFAYNRRQDPADRHRALEILEELQDKQGPTSETSSLIGRIYKSQWEEARARGQPGKARGFLKQAIAAYVQGFEADWRHPYPGINAVTLLDIQGGTASVEQKRRLLPAVRFATEQRLRGPAPTYWDHAILLEIAVLENDVERARDALDFALTAATESWQRDSTTANLRIIERARKERGHDVGWLAEIINELAPSPAEPAIMTPPVPASARSVPASASRIFVSYRRDDAASAAGRLVDHLVGHFGKGQVFQDVDSIQPGDDFAAEITAAVESCAVLLAVIGTRWLAVTNGKGQPRLDNPEDFVRLEIEAALKRNIRVIPILVDGARMPSATDLPTSLAPLARRHALDTSPSRFRSDMNYLVQVLEDRVFGEAAQPASS
jgi:hypothetical protein